MAPLLPSESAAYTLALPEETDDDRQNLKYRTGAALCYTSSSVVVHGGLTLPLGLPDITTPTILKSLQSESIDLKHLSNYISNEVFYLDIINRKWNRLDIDPAGPKPSLRFYHSLAFDGKSIYLFGGLVLDKTSKNLIPTNDLWELNVHTKEWLCIDDGLTSGSIARYDHQIHVVDYTSPIDGLKKTGITITGGRGELNQELKNVAIYDLKDKSYVNTSDMKLSLNELIYGRNNSTTSAIDPKVTGGDREKLKSSSESSFIVTGATNTEDSKSKNDVFYILSPSNSKDELITNPLVSLPISPDAVGLRLPLSAAVKKNTSVVPNDLKYPSGGIFGTNVIVSGTHPESKEYRVYLFNKPSQKWTRLNIDNKKKASELYLWKSFSWPSHHKVLVLGSGVVPKGGEYSTAQVFDLLVLVGLPITNIFHAFTVPESNASDKKFSPAFASLKENTSFEAYSKYIAPSTKISSIRSVFPNYAITLGRNAFERFGSYLADFEFITADGDKINVPLMLLRKRWGRCFDMLLAKAYARAVYQLENKKDYDGADQKAPDTESTGGSKRSLLVLNKASQNSERDVPQFRLPFQDKSSAQASSQNLTVTNSGGPTSRKASIVSTGGSIVSNSTNGDADEIDFESLPPQLPFPNEPLPSLDKTVPLKSFSSRDYLRDSPRGSISGASMAPSTSNFSQNSTGIKLKDLRSSNTTKKRGASRSSSFQTGEDNNSVNDIGSGLESPVPENDNDLSEETASLLEPLLIPRSLYLPFSTGTVQAFAEFLFTGQLGDDWLLTPTTLDSFLIAKFYELPLLYDLISEALYAIIGKKEDSLIKDYGILLSEYQEKLKQIFKNDETKIVLFFKDHPNVNEAFQEIETYLNTVDDGYLNLSLLRKASKVSTVSTAASSIKTSVDLSKRRPSANAVGRAGKSSLSKEVNLDNDDGVNIDDEDEDEEAQEEDEEETIAPALNFPTSTSEGIKFKTDSMSIKSAKTHKSYGADDVDPLTKSSKIFNKPLNGTIDGDESNKDEKTTQNIDSDDPLSGSASINKESQSSSGDVDPFTIDSTQNVHHRTESESEKNTFQVPEGRFEIAKDQLTKVNSNESSSDQNNLKESTSDSDDLAVGLGLVKNLKLKEKKNKSEESRAGQDGGDNDSDEEEDDASNLPTLANLASVNSPAPADQLLQIIFEAAALACDMKLLLRSVNVLEMSKFFVSKRAELMKELDEYGIKYKEDLEKEELALKEQEKAKQREFEQTVQAERGEAELKNPSQITTLKEEELRNITASRLSSKENLVSGLEAPYSSNDKDAESSQKSSIGQSNGNTSLKQEVATQQPLDSSPTSQVKADASSNFTTTEEVSPDATTKQFNLRSAFSSFKSLSSLNLSGNQNRNNSTSGNSEVSKNSTKSSILRNPFSSTRGTPKKKGFFSFISSRRSTSEN